MDWLERGFAVGGIAYGDWVRDLARWWSWRMGLWLKRWTSGAKRKAVRGGWRLSFSWLSGKEVGVEERDEMFERFGMVCGCVCVISSLVPMPLV